jgi:hypothetical protein
MGSGEKPPDARRDHDAYERESAWAAGLKARYDEVAEKPLPDKFRELLERIEDAESRKR